MTEDEGQSGKADGAKPGYPDISAHPDLAKNGESETEALARFSEMIDKLDREGLGRGIVVTTTPPIN